MVSDNFFLKNQRRVFNFPDSDDLDRGVRRIESFVQDHVLLARSNPFLSRARVTRGLPMGGLRTLMMDQQPMNQQYIIY